MLTLILRNYRVVTLLSFSCFRIKFLFFFSYNNWQIINIFASYSIKANNKYKMIKRIKYVEKFFEKKINNLFVYIIFYSQYLFLN